MEKTANFNREPRNKFPEKVYFVIDDVIKEVTSSFDLICSEYEFDDKKIIFALYTDNTINEWEVQPDIDIHQAVADKIKHTLQEKHQIYVDTSAFYNEYGHCDISVTFKFSMV